MNKKIMFISIMLLALLIVSAIPAYAKPTNGPNKKAVALDFTKVTKKENIDTWFSNGIRHRIVHISFDVELEITGGLTLVGTAFVVRLTVYNPTSMKIVMRDYYEFSFPAVIGGFPTEDGGFEGNGLVMNDGFVPAPPPPATWEQSKAKGLFHGTGAFEGQTLNIGHPWRLKTESILWDGYWLNCPY